MKHLIGLLLITFLSSSFLYATSAEERFAFAQELYDSKKYEEALSEYKTIVSQEGISSELYFNIGNVHYRLGNIAQAVWNYEKSLQLNPGNESAKENLSLTFLQVRDKTSMNRAASNSSWLTLFLYNKPNNFWSILAIVFILIGTIGGLIFLFSSKSSAKSSGLFGGLIALLLSVAFMILASFHSNHLDANREKFAIITEPFTKVLTEPTKNGKRVFDVHSGSKVMIKSSTGEWYEIQAGQDLIGWIKKERVAPF